MSTTFTLPSGRKLRSQSQRRYVLVSDYPDYQPSIHNRSDSVETLRKIRSRQTRYPTSFLLILDTVTKGVVS